MTDYRSLYDRLYVSAWELGNKDVSVTISKVTGGELVGEKGRKRKRPIIHFVGKEKAFVANVTNGKTIAGMYGTKIEDWVGKRITLYVSMTRSPDGSGDVECIRIRPTPPQGKAAVPEQGSEAEKILGDLVEHFRPQEDGPPTITEVSALIQAGKLDDAEALAAGIADVASRTVWMAQIKAKRRETT